jgi:hypothetical protein
MARALKNITVFMIIELTAKVGTFAGKGLGLIITIEEDKSCGDQKT